MGIPIYQVDAFTKVPFGGNPAAICVLDAPRAISWMQAVATEMNLSETAFLLKLDDGFSLRWFTPTVEVDLCGHATLASAHILWETGLIRPADPARFHTHSGLLTAERTGNEIELNFPLVPEQPATPPPTLCKALGVAPKYVGRNQYDYLIEVESEEAVKTLKPDFTELRSLDLRGVMVTSASSSAEYDFVSRFFAPGSGIDEDPVTGSAHCCLGPFWGRRLGKEGMVAYQASARGGVVQVRLDGDRVRLRGHAVTVLRGEWVTD